LFFCILFLIRRAGSERTHYVAFNREQGREEKIQTSVRDIPSAAARRNQLTGLIMWSVVALAIGVVRVTIAHSESFTVAPSTQQQQHHRSNSAGSQSSSTSSLAASSSSSSSSSTSTLSSSSLSSTNSYLPPIQLSPSSDIQFHDEDSFNWDDRVHRYCAQPAFMASSEGRQPIWSPSSSNSSSSSSSSTTTSTSLKLVQAIVLIRHGDRSAIHHLPSESTVAGTPASWTCGKPDAKDAAWANRVVKPFTSTSECIIETDGDNCLHLEALSIKEAMDEATAPIPADGDVARHALGIKNAKNVDSKCSTKRGGELTTLGWAQHRAIGADLGAFGSVDAYRELLFRKDEEKNEVPGESSGTLSSSTSSKWKRKALIASTTDYGRTALSLQAFVMGLLKGPEGNDKVDVEEDNENGKGDVADLPGLGPLPIPLHIVQRSLDHSLWSKGPPAGMCPRSETYVALDKELLSLMARLPSDVSTTVAGLTNKLEGDLPGDEETADAMLCRICHGISLPCWNEGGEGGTGEGGKEAEEEVLAVASGRCLTQAQAARIVMRADAIYSVRSASRATKLNTYPILSDIVKTLQQAAEKRENSPRFVVRAGHDTVVAPILASLGAVDGAFAWPGFASRIVLELWEASSSSTTTSTSEYLVRMTLNGKDVTSSLSCSQENPEKSYCTLSGFSALVDQLIAPASSWAEACALPVGEEERQSTSSTVQMMSVSAAASAIPLN
jgi:hypothetical protein